MADNTIFDKTDQPDTSINPDAPVEPVAEETPSDQPKIYDEAYVKELNQEAGKWRLKLRETETRLKELEAAEKKREQEAKQRETQQLEAAGDYEKLKAEYDKQLAEISNQNQDLINQITSTKRQGLVMRIANQLGAIDPLDANFLMAVSEVDPASDDADKQIAAVFEQIKEQKPYLFRAEPAPNSPQNLAQFNPSTVSNRHESDRERLARINRQAGQTITPFGN